MVSVTGCLGLLVMFISSSCFLVFVFFFFQAEDGIRDLVRSRGLGDVYKRQGLRTPKNLQVHITHNVRVCVPSCDGRRNRLWNRLLKACLLYTSDAADDLLCVDLGGRRIIKKKKIKTKKRLKHIPSITMID